jgi:sugar/nucleoside kinase (ribokinase family)
MRDDEATGRIAGTTRQPRAIGRGTSDGDRVAPAASHGRLGVVVGNPVADAVHQDGVPVRRACGGTATYATLALRTLGLDAVLVGAVGDDHADMLRAPLASAGVDLRGLRVDGGPSTAYVLDYDGPTGERRVRLRHRGPPVRPGDLPHPPGAAFVHIGAFAGEVLPATVARLASWGIPLGVDLHVLRCFANDGSVRLGDAAATGIDFGLFDTIKGAFEEIRAFAPSAGGDLQAAMRAIAALGVRHVLATDGRHGALMQVDGVVEIVPAFPVREVDATGAGDVFLAGFLAARHALGEPARDAARFGAATASFVVEGPGASRLGDLASVLARRAALATV